MARKNRVTVPDGIYHVTSRICNKAMLLKPDEVKEKIWKWIFDIADFSGVEIYAWCIMDNHLHLLVHVPRVPQSLWTDPSREPESWAFGMRPPECNPPLWIDRTTTDLPSAGDSPRSADRCVDELPLEVLSNGRKLRCLLRPEVGFMLDDESMVAKLARLYSKTTAEDIAARWRKLRENQRGDEVDAEKVKYCRRMYNISQFVKTLKERVAMRFNAEFDREGCLWQGRFYSGIIEDCREVLAVVAGYIDYNPVKAKLVSSPVAWRFSSWSLAVGGGNGAAYCRRMYSKMLDCEWEQAKEIMQSVLDDRLPDGVDPDDVKGYYDRYDDSCDEMNVSDHDDEADNSGEQPTARCYRASQVIRCGMWFFKKGGYIGRTMDFAWATVMHLPLGFPRLGFKSIRQCRAFVWELPCSTPSGPECKRLAA